MRRHHLPTIAALLLLAAGCSAVASLSGDLPLSGEVAEVESAQDEASEASDSPEAGGAGGATAQATASPSATPITQDPEGDSRDAEPEAEASMSAAEIENAVDRCWSSYRLCRRGDSEQQCEYLRSQSECTQVDDGLSARWDQRQAEAEEERSRAEALEAERALTRSLPGARFNRRNQRLARVIKRVAEAYERERGENARATRVYFGSDDWLMQRNGIGILVGRRVEAAIAFRRRAGGCYMISAEFYSERRGRSWGPPILRTGYGDGEFGIKGDMQCRNVR
ncbi:MAG: hypothetical protein OEY14_02925 [Myxococcales bacterium]|nr:hypothetical protein [Myxococcales bacterium]